MTPIWPLLPVETGSWIFQKIISHEPQKIFLQSLHHLKDVSLYYISYTDMTLIWPLLPVENGRSRKKKYSEVLFRMYCVHPVRAQTAFPPHIIIVCHTYSTRQLVFNRVARRTWTPCVQCTFSVYQSLGQVAYLHHGCEFCRETWEIHIFPSQRIRLGLMTSQKIYVTLR